MLLYIDALYYCTLYFRKIFAASLLKISIFVYRLSPWWSSGLLKALSKARLWPL